MPHLTRQLFIGLQPPPQAAERLAARVRPLVHDLPGVRIYAPEDIHLTLAYLGPIPEEQLGPLRLTLQEEVRGMNAPELSLAGSGAFPDRAGPRALWAGVVEEGEVQGRLAALRNRALQAALALGWRGGAAERNRSFTPHLTVAKVADGANIQPFLDQDWSGDWLPVEVVLFESCGSRAPERYRPLAAIPLVVRPG